MTYTPDDAARDQFFEELEKELYPQHREQAIEEFTRERLQSFYTNNPCIAANAFRSYKEAKSLADHGHASASFVFSVSSIEQFLKIALLKPVVYGLIHHEPLADLIVELTIGQSGFDRYNKLLSKLFETLAEIDITNVTRQGSTKKLLDEVTELQKTRNKIIHQGVEVEESEAKEALDVTVAVLGEVVLAMLNALGLQIEKGGRIVPSIWPKDI